MKQKLFKGLGVTLAASAGFFLMGVIGFGRRCAAILPIQFANADTVGMAFIIAGAVISAATSIFFLRSLHLFSSAKADEENAADLLLESMASFKVSRALTIAFSALAAMMGFGLGLGMMFDEITMYILYILAIVFLVSVGAVIFLLAPVLNRDIRHRFAWSAAILCVCTVIALFAMAAPAVKDMRLGEEDVTAVTGTVSKCRPNIGILSGPGRANVVIKGTSGETITLRYDGFYGELQPGERYTFYYLPNTRLVEKTVKADNVKIDG